MELRQLRYFLKVAELLNFSEASKALFVTQSTLSQQIKQLETELDTTLFERNSHEVTLTEAGQKLVRYAQKVVVDADICQQKMADLKSLLTGELNIGVTFTFSPLLTETVLEFMERYPDVHLNIIYKTMAELMDMLQRHEVDFVLAFKPTEKNERVESYLLFNNNLVAVMSSTHPFAKRKSISLEDLKACQIAMPACGLQARNAFDDMIESSANNIKTRLEINDINILLKLVRQSKLVTVLAEATIHNEEELVGIPLEMHNDDMEGCIHMLKNAYIKNSAREFCRLLSQSRSIMKYSSISRLL
jgi:lysR substrate binding domain protein